MTTQVQIISAIATVATSLGYTVFQTDISEKDLADTQMPALIISNINTEYNRQMSAYGWVETYTIGLILKLEASSNNLSSLVTAQRALIVALLADAPLKRLLVRDSLNPTTSNASNAIAQHSPNGSKAVSCILNLTCSAVQSV